MKRLASILLVFFGTMIAILAADVKQLHVQRGSLLVEDVPFKIESISISNQNLVKVEVISENGRQIRISGLETGITDVQVLGGGMSQVYNVTVSDDLRQLFNALKRDLDAVPEVDISINNGKLVLKGELSSITNQELKNKVVKSYGNVILDLTTFRPTPEVMLGLQKNFEQAGFKVVRNTTNSDPGEISITQVGEMLTITGSVYGPEDLNKINSILSAQPWLTINTDNNTSSNNKVQAYVNVQVLPVMLQVDVVHIAVNKQEARGIGIDWSAFVQNGFGVGTQLMYAVQAVRGEGISQEGLARFSAMTNGNLAAWLELFGNNNITRARRAGFLTFKSNDTPEFRRMQNGGTLVISSDAAPGSSSQLKEYEYGLILEVKGGLTGADTVSIELKQELSYPGPITPFANDAKLDLKKFATSTSFTCQLGQTIAIGGLKEFSENNIDKSAIPYLRNVPVLKWFLSQEDTTFREDEIVTLICVHKMDQSSSIDPVAEQLEKMKQAEDQKMADHEAEVHKNDGKWYEFWKW